MDENVKDLIKIPEGLDKAILKGLEEGKKKKKLNKGINKIKKGTIAAAVVVASITVAGVINPEIVSAIPIVNRVFGYFEGYSIDKYQELGEVINQTIEKNGTKITLDQIIVDDNMFMASITVESDDLKGFDRNNNDQGDFFYPDFELKINGEGPRSWGSKVKIINETKGVAILEADIGDIKLEEDLKIDLDIRGIERSGKIIVNGKFKYNIKTTKGIESEIYTGDKKIKVDGGEFGVDSLIKTPLTNKLTIKGKYENMSNEIGKILGFQYLVNDNNGNRLIADTSGGNIKPNGEFEEGINIENDLTNVEYIEVLLTNGNEMVKREINGREVNLLVTTDSLTGEVNRKEEIISRKPTENELKSGYAFDAVQYYLNIDRSKAFMSIEELKGKIINVNYSDSVIITNVEVDDEFTKVSMKINGSYDYNNLSSLVIFDEDMNDTAIWEGHRGVVLENPETKEFSMTLRAIDKIKKYTIAIPMTNEIKYNEESRIVVKIK